VTKKKHLCAEASRWKAKTAACTVQIWPVWAQRLYFLEKAQPTLKEHLVWIVIKNLIYLRITLILVCCSVD